VKARRALAYSCLIAEQLAPEAMPHRRVLVHQNACTVNGMFTLGEKESFGDR